MRSGAAAGVGWMLLTGLCFVGVTVTVKHLGGGMPAPQSAFLRYLIGVLIVGPALVPILRAGLSRAELARFSLRGFVHALGVMGWFAAMTRLPVAEVTAMGYLTPAAVTLAAVFMFGERLSGARVMAVAAAFVGVLIVVRPGIREISAGHLFMLANMVFFSISYLMAKRMSAERSATVVVGMLSLTTTIALAPFAASVWVAPTGQQLAWLTLVAVLATIGHWTMTRAFAAAPLGVTQPVVFLQLVWATAAGAILFAERVDGWIVLGGAIIVGAVTSLAWREARATGLRAATSGAAASPIGAGSTPGDRESTASGRAS